MRVLATDVAVLASQAAAKTRVLNKFLYHPLEVAANPLNSLEPFLIVCCCEQGTLISTQLIPSFDVINCHQSASFIMPALLLLDLLNSPAALRDLCSKGLSRDCNPTEAVSPALFLTYSVLVGWPAYVLNFCKYWVCNSNGKVETFQCQGVCPNADLCACRCMCPNIRIQFYF